MPQCTVKRTVADDLWSGNAAGVSENGMCVETHGARDRGCQRAGTKRIVLTCKESLIPFYERFGFVNEGKSMSKHGEPCGMICGWYLKNCRKRNYYNMKKHRLPYMVAGAVLFAALLPDVPMSA